MKTDKTKQLIEEAWMLARKAHEHQTYDLWPYEKHLRDVVQVLIDAGYSNRPVIIISGILHDSLEDSHIHYGDIKTYFGFEVAEIVFAVTDELGRNRKERKLKTLPKTAANRDAVAVKIADRIANVEHSKRTGNSMFKRYQQEHDQFYDYLSRADEHRALWERLEQAIQ